MRQNLAFQIRHIGEGSTVYYSFAKTLTVERDVEVCRDSTVTAAFLEMESEMLSKEVKL